ncbi:MAG: beta-N-acetylhexosaminidase [Deltaproteobacteria bacterium]|nr:beta-N-acetylhexosaminidase [Deltaproteobacteria bacterium]MBW2203206.1 beta-N-acetylhexosaminidase [Deltaproteobacteria bacterium]
MQSTLDLSELDLRIGSLFMAGMPGPELDGDTEALIRNHCLGGIILFARNIENPVQLASLCHNLQETAMEQHGTPLFLAVDQEGGRVARLKEPFTLFPGNSAIGNDSRPVDRAMEFGVITAREMALVGLNMNMAPVVDVRWGEPEKHLDGRIFSDDPEKVALLGQTVVKSLQENGVMAVAKHFPGLGRATLDPHHHLPTIDASTGEIEEINLPPFRAVIEQDVSAVMTSHAIYSAFDPMYPGTLSNKIITGLLRKKLGFEGLIITDDLEMGAIKKGWGVAKGAVAAFEAGSDLFLICEDQEEVMAGMMALRDSLLRGDVPLERLHQSSRRIMAAKARFLGGGIEISFAKVKEYFDKDV